MGTMITIKISVCKRNDTQNRKFIEFFLIFFFFHKKRYFQKKVIDIKIGTLKIVSTLATTFISKKKWIQSREDSMGGVLLFSGERIEF